MDFRQSSQSTNNRTAPPEPVAPAASPETTSTPRGPKRLNVDSTGNRWLKILNVVVLVGTAIIVGLLALSVARTSGGDNEFKYVDQSRYQAVFLQNGQVYFGNIKSLNAKYIRLTNVYYLTQNSTTTDSSSAATAANSAYNLVQLGKCQIHYPDNQMVINHDQITFWENLQNSGQVVTSINQLKKQFPNGQTCSQPSSQTQASNTGTTQQGTTSPTTTTTK